MKTVFIFFIILTSIVFVHAQSKNESANLFFEQGEILLNKGEYLEAMEQFNKCLQLNPGYSEAYLNRALVKQQLHNMQGAHIDLCIYLSCCTPRCVSKSSNSQ